MSSRSVAAAAFLIIMALIFTAFWPGYQARRQAEKNNKTIAIALDFEDLYAAAQADPQALKDFLTQARHIPVSVLALSEEASLADEQTVRTAGFSILWQIKTTNFGQLYQVLDRFKKGDGCMSTEKQAPGFPMYVGDVARILRDKKAFLPAFEFLPQLGFQTLARGMNGSLIKAHLIADREVLVPQQALWKNRIRLAARERGIRFFYLRLSPAQRWEKNRQFLNEMAQLLTADGFTLSSPQPFQGWEKQPASSSRAKMAVLIATLAPLLGFWIFAKRSHLPWYGRFLCFCCFSAVSGATAYLMGSTEALVLGVASLGGVKIQLLFPLLGAALLVIGWEDLEKCLDQPIKVKHLFLVGGLLGAGAALYLMRSGNFPLLPVSNTERGFRNLLENFFGARPRFKEFLIGHPALLAAFYLQDLGFKPRVLLLIGLIGQISILNTFLHFHIPLEYGLLRTFHGAWLGALIFVPVYWVVRQ